MTTHTESCNCPCKCSVCQHLHGNHEELPCDMDVHLINRLPWEYQGTFPGVTPAPYYEFNRETGKITQRPRRYNTETQQYEIVYDEDEC